MPADQVGAVLVRVARETGRSLLAIARDPYALTLWTFLTLVDADRIERLTQRFDRLEQAGLMAFGVNEPRRLGDVYLDLQDEIGDRPTDDDVAALAAGAAAAVQRLIDEGG